MRRVSPSLLAAIIAIGSSQVAAQAAGQISYAGADAPGVRAETYASGWYTHGR